MASTIKHPKYPSFVHLSTRGTFYDVGYNVGVSFSRQLQCFFAESKDIQNKLLPFYDSSFGRQYFEESLKVTQECFPRYIREVQGMSDGSGIPFAHLFMNNVSKEVYNVLLDPLYKEKESLQKNKADKEKSIDNFGCSDVFINRPDLKVIVHNEDCDPLMKPYGYLLSADIEDDGVKEEFSAFYYPGYLPGCAFGFNVHGLTISVDGLYPDKITRNSPGRIFLNRALLSAKNIQDACHILENEPFGTSFAFCANISTAEHEMYSIEVGPNKPKSDLHIYQIQEQSDVSKPCHYYHFNSYQHLPVSFSDFTDSSLCILHKCQVIRVIIGIIVLVD